MIKEDKVDQNVSTNELGIEHFFRNEYGNVLSYLSSKFGIHYLEQAEDAIQEALIKAMKIWPFKGVPDNPKAWIRQVANNALLDQIRRAQKVYYTTQVPEQLEKEQSEDESIIKDSVLQMIFACCNPNLSMDYQLILTLKILGGLSIDEIAAGLLKKKESVAKSYTRAKKQFKKENLKLEIPGEKEIANRMQSVLRTVYLLFNEGYKSNAEENLIRLDICDEALRLATILTENEHTRNSSSLSLLALMHFHASRFETRMDDNGLPISLKEQDRSKWNQRHIDHGNYFLSQAGDEQKDPYFLQASISAMHAIASSFQNTNWKVITHLYQQLMNIQSNPQIELNYIVAVLYAYDEKEAMRILKQFQDKHIDYDNHIFHAVKAEIHESEGNIGELIAELKKAEEKTPNVHEKLFFQEKLKKYVDDQKMPENEN